MPDLGQMVRRQRVLADFGEFALRSEDLGEALTEACRLVGEALGTGRAKVLEIEHEGQTLLVRAGVGWKPDIVGKLRLEMSEHSSETFSIEAGRPVITRDIREEGRFEVPAFLKDAGVVALVNVPIFLPGGEAYGLLQVDATEARAFGEDDTEFLRTYATILGPVIDRLHKVRKLQTTEERFRLIVENARDYAVLVTDAEDRITDWMAGPGRRPSSAGRRRRRSDSPAPSCSPRRTGRAVRTRTRPRRPAGRAWPRTAAGTCARTGRGCSSTVLSRRCAATGARSAGSSRSARTSPSAAGPRRRCARARRGCAHWSRASRSWCTARAARASGSGAARSGWPTPACPRRRA